MNDILHGNSVDVIKTLPDCSVDMCVTSPPYYGLRDYGCDEQIGLEETPEEYINRLVEVFHEIKRVLKDDGTLWVNIGDSYAYSGKGSGGTGIDTSSKQSTNVGANFASGKERIKQTYSDCKPKDMIGIPWMLAFALRKDGWYLRQDIIWEKPNPMPEPVKDRCVKSHEYIFLLSKKKDYYFDYEAIQEDAKCKDDRRAGLGHITYDGKRGNEDDVKIQKSFVSISDKRNKRDVWRVALHPIKEAHFATFPKALITPCILAGCRPCGVVIDPFFGSGTTGVVAEENNRNFIGIELNQDYIDIAKKRLDKVQTKLF